LERPASQANFAPLNVTVPSGAQLLSIGGVAQSIAADSAGDVFAFGQIRTTTTTKRGTVYTDYGALFEMPAGQSNFTPVYTSTSFRPVEMTDVGSGPSAGIYVIEDGTWKVDKSTDGGASWTTVDSYNYDPNNLHETFAWALVSDSTGNGNVFVAGQGQRKVITGYKTVKVNGKLVQQPIYGFENHWLTRQSSDGGVTWTTVDDFRPVADARERECAHRRCRSRRHRLRRRHVLRLLRLSVLRHPHQRRRSMVHLRRRRQW
jgi:hypothetical protein